MARRTLPKARRTLHHQTLNHQTVDHFEQLIFYQELMACSSRHTASGSHLEWYPGPLRGLWRCSPQPAGCCHDQTS